MEDIDDIRIFLLRLCFNEGLLLLCMNRSVEMFSRSYLYRSLNFGNKYLVTLQTMTYSVAHKKDLLTWNRICENVRQAIQYIFQTHEFGKKRMAATNIKQDIKLLMNLNVLNILRNELV